MYGKAGKVALALLLAAGLALCGCQPKQGGAAPVTPAPTPKATTGKAMIGGGDLVAFKEAPPATAPVATPVPTVKPTGTPVPTVKPTGTPVPTVKPTGTPVPTVKPTGTPVPTVKPTGTPKPSVTPAPPVTPPPPPPPPPEG